METVTELPHVVLQLSEEFNIAILLTNQVISDPSGELLYFVTDVLYL